MPNTPLKWGQITVGFAPPYLILTNYFQPLRWALATIKSMHGNQL